MGIQCQTLVVVGGGSAGWLTANALLKSLPEHKVVLIEDPNTPTIGVGEGSTPALKAFFDLLNVPENKWMPACDATYKNGIRFVNWSSKQEFQSYFHAFPSIIDNNTLSPFFHNCQKRVSGQNVVVNPNEFFLTAKLSELKKSPIPTDNFPFDVNYGYHFDSGKLASFLSSYAKTLGIRHIQQKVERVVVGANGNISSLILQEGQEIRGDVFFDCSGFNSLIAKQVLDIPFVSYKDQLLNNTAVVIKQIETGLVRESQTISKAMSAGWSWQIPLVSRKGHGYVFSSNFINKEQAKQELLKSIDDDGMSLEGEFKFIDFKLGRLSHFWDKNCIAIGLSQGFIEPLEATALFIIQQTVGKFIDYWLAGNCSDTYRDRFNNELTDLFDGIKDYVLLHYKLGGREDSDYWRFITHEVELPNRLIALQKAWLAGKHFVPVIKELGLDKYYPISSWYSIFAGSGYFSTVLNNVDEERFNVAKVQDFICRASMNYSDHVTELNKIRVPINSNNGNI
ncbi:tryptophan halogenase family protein [Glaciecola sp. 2405UD65-10]|uniref:tryptophan halogenase family protein n=1 Tax=Glaciecola sp. 2405UD65-10 TaxID=3397244 RepID=UPI003B5AB12A